MTRPWRGPRGSLRPSLYDPSLLERPYPEDAIAGPQVAHLRMLQLAHPALAGHQDQLTIVGWALHLPWATNPVPMNRSGRTSGWRAEAKKAAAVRETAFQLVNGCIPDLGRIRVRLDWYVTTKRTRDPDNLVKCAKHLVDGIGARGPVSAGIVPDDSPDYVDREFPRILLAPEGLPAHMRLWIWPAPRE